MKRLFCQFVFVFSLITSNALYAETPYSDIYIFGNSLSDTGNLSSVVGDLPYPYYMNRITNGPVAVDILAARLGLNADASLHVIGPEVGTNYAVASAAAVGNDLQDLTTQITLFHANHGFSAPPSALYVMFIGGNDVRATRKTTDDAVAKNIIQDAADSIQAAMTSLTLAGARHFLLVNSINIALTPEIIITSSLNNDPDLLERSRKYSKLFRNKLHAIEDKLEATYPVDIKEFDLFTFFNKLVKKADDYGFTNTTEACFSRDTFSFHEDCYFGLNFDQFIFFDEIHPTAKAHALVGEALYQQLINKTDSGDY